MARVPGPHPFLQETGLLMITVADLQRLR